MPVSPPPWCRNHYETLAEFRSVLRKFLGFSEGAVRKLKVTSQQYQSLLAVEGYPGRNWVTVGELAERMHIVPQSAGRLVSRLEAMRLVKRVSAKKARRSARISLTPKGLRLLERLDRMHRAELQGCGPQLAALLQKITAPIPEKIVLASPACSMPEIED